jgi:DNA-binding winged helix-turn-helix (wHTH) protein
MIPARILIPRRWNHLLHRPRLLDRLHRHVDRALTFITAPVGYGKTSLLVDFSHEAPFPVCWLSLDDSDRDLHTFVEHLVASLRHRFPAFGRATRRALASKPGRQRDPAVLADVIVQDTLDNIPEFFALILDDYHAVDGSKEVNELLGVFLIHRPAHRHLIVAGRTAPVGLPIIQLTARSQIAALGPAHLAFTAQEVQTFLAYAHNVHLSLAQAEELVAHSGGWIGAIVLSTNTMWQGMRDSLVRADLRRALQSLSEDAAVSEAALRALVNDRSESRDRTALQRVVASGACGGTGQESPRGVVVEAARAVAEDERSFAPRGQWVVNNGRWVLDGGQWIMGGNELMQLGDLTINVEAREVSRQGQSIQLSKLEFDLLVCLIRQRNRVVTYDELLERVWGYVPDCHTPKLVRMTISRLRQELGDDPHAPRYIANVRGVGYRLL